jgi:hypothetical protein
LARQKEIKIYEEKAKVKSLSPTRNPNGLEYSYHDKISAASPPSLLPNIINNNNRTARFPNSPNLP